MVVGVINSLRVQPLNVPLTTHSLSEMVSYGWLRANRMQLHKSPPFPVGETGPLNRAMFSTLPPPQLALGLKATYFHIPLGLYMCRLASR